MAVDEDQTTTQEEYQSQNEQQQEQDETLKDQQQHKEEEEENAAEASNDAAVVEVNGSREASNNEEIDEEEDLDLEDKSVEKFLEIFTMEQLRALVKLAVWKDPVLADNVRQLADVGYYHRYLIVTPLRGDLTAEILTSVFGKYGELEECRDFDKNFAFILFKHGNGARKALKHPLKKIGNITMECKFVNSVVDIPPSPLLESEPRISEFTKRIDFAPIIDKYMESAKNALEEPHKIFEGHTLYCQKAVDGPKGNMGHHQQQHHHHHNQPHYHSKEKKSKYSHGDGPSHCGDGHMMAPTSPVAGGYNRGVPQQGYNRAPVNQAVPIPVAYGNQIAMNYENQPWMQWGYQNPGQGGHYWNPLGMQHGYQNPQMGQGGPYENPPGMQHGYQNPQMGQGGPYENPPGMQHGYQNSQMGQGGPYGKPPGMQHGYQNSQMGQGGHYWNPSGMQHGYQNPRMGQGGPYWNPPGMQHGYQNSQMGQGGHYGNPLPPMG